MKKIILSVLTLLLIIPSAIAAFSLSADSLSVSACSTTTELVIAEVTNFDSVSNTYTLSLSGSASQWTIISPSGFVLGPGQSTNIYIYVTPSLSAQEGVYNTRLTVSSTGLSQFLDFTVLVPQCNGLSLNTQNDQRDICSGRTADFLLNLKNEGQWSETYDIIVSGETEDWTSLSRLSLFLSSGESEEFNAFVTMPETEIGEYSLTITASSRDSDAVISQDVTIYSEDCYDFDLSTTENFVSFCDNSEAKIPLIIDNFGTESNIYELSLSGNSWSILDKDRLVIPSGSSKTFNLILTPSHGQTGTEQFTVLAKAQDGNKLDSTTINANILTCRQTSLEAAVSETQLCVGAADSVDFSLVNSGRFEENYALSIDGPSWTSLEYSFVLLESGESRILNLNLNPDLSVNEGSYNIKVKAKSQNIGSTESSSTVLVNIPSQTECYNIKANSDNNIELAYGSGTLIPISLENRGIKTDIFEFSISGEGATFAQINPGAIKLTGNTNKEVYLFVSIPRDAELGVYPLKVSINSESGLSSDSVYLNLIIREGRINQMVAGVGDLTGSAVSGVKSVFGGLSSKISELFSRIISYISPTTSTISEGITHYWYVFPALLILLIFIQLSLKVRDSKTWMKELELLEMELENGTSLSTKKSITLSKTFSTWWKNVKPKPKVVTKTISKPKKKLFTKPNKIKQTTYWSKFVNWLNEEPTKPKKKKVLTKKSPTKKISTKKPKSKKPEFWISVKDFFLEEVPNVKIKPIETKPKKKSKSFLEKTMEWLDDESDPIVKLKKPKKKKPTKKNTKSLWQKFTKWLEEE